MQRFTTSYKAQFGLLQMELENMEMQVKKMAKRRVKQRFCRVKDTRRLYSAGDIDILLQEDVTFHF